MPAAPDEERCSGTGKPSASRVLRSLSTSRAVVAERFLYDGADAVEARAGQDVPSAVLVRALAVGGDEAGGCLVDEHTVARDGVVDGRHEAGGLGRCVSWAPFVAVSPAGSGVGGHHEALARRVWIQSAAPPAPTWCTP